MYDGRNTGAARRTCPRDVWPVARRKLDMLSAATADVDLRTPPSNHFEKLSGNLAGFCSIRINSQYRIVFRWEPPDVAEVFIDDYH